MCKLIIFDFDGVVVDSEVISNRVLAEAMTEEGRPMTTPQALEIFAGKTLADVVATIGALCARDLPEDYADRLHRRTLEALRRDVRAFEGAVEFITGLGGIGFCIGSTSRPDRIGVCLEAIGLEAAFAGNVFSVAHVKRNKPFPDIFLHAAEKMGVRPADTVVVEDSVNGVRAGRSAGMQVIGFTAGSHLQPGHAARLIEAGAFVTVASYAQLAAKVDRLRVETA